MINILVPGKPYEQEETFYIESCGRCFCQFEFQESDSKNVLRNWLSKEFYYDVKCPACGLQITGYTNGLQRRVNKYTVEPSGNSNINPIIHSNG